MESKRRRLLELEAAHIQASSMAAKANKWDLEVMSLHKSDIERRLRELPAGHVKKKRRRVKVMKYNAPKGVEFAESQGGFFSSLSFCGHSIPIPPHRDLQTHVTLRTSIMARIDSLLRKIVKHKITDENIINSARCRILALAQYPAEETKTTPKKSIVFEKLNATPTSLMPVDIIKMRDKYFARAKVGSSDFVDGPQRAVRSEAENDAVSLSLEIAKPVDETPQEQIIRIRLFASSSDFKAVTPQPMPDNIYASQSGSYFSLVKVFTETLETPSRDTVMKVLEDRAKCEAELKRVKALVSTSKSPNVHRQTEQILRAMDRFVKALAPEPFTPAALPPGMHRVRDKLYSTVDVLGQQLTTPVRNYTNEVVADMATAESAIKELGACGNRDMLVSEIKQRWASANQMKTPRKVSLSN